MSLSDSERAESEDIAELKVRRYFDNYLQNVFPAQVKQMLLEHNNDPEAHDGVAKKVSRAQWLITGAMTVMGLGTGAALKGLLSKLGL